MCSRRNRTSRPRSCTRYRTWAGHWSRCTTSCSEGIRRAGRLKLVVEESGARHVRCADVRVRRAVRRAVRLVGVAVGTNAERRAVCTRRGTAAGLTHRICVRIVVAADAVRAAEAGAAVRVVCAGEADRAARARAAVTVRAATLPGVAARFADGLARGGGVGGVVVVACIDRPSCGCIRRRGRGWRVARRMQRLDHAIAS
jgi:hypothetical protein